MPIGGIGSRRRLRDDFHALALDQRGHGDSDWASEWAYGSRHYVSDLEQIIAHWEYGAPILVGHSMGAHNGLLYAAGHGRILPAMVIIDNPARVHRDCGPVPAHICR